jgi:SAM-dependent methyltransferase
MVKSNDIFSDIHIILKSQSFWTKAFLIGIIAYIIAKYVKKDIPIIEGFIQEKDFVFKQGPDIFDDFYVNLYDKLLYSKVKNDYEIGKIVNDVSPDDNTLILDIGSGTGHHVNQLTEQGFKALGIDISPSMVEYAKTLYPKNDYRNLDHNNSMNFNENTFSIITSLYFTLYYIEDKQKFFENCYKWLIPGGELAVHLVNKDLFDPVVLPSNPFIHLSPQKYTAKRITNSSVKFKGFQYKSDFKLDDNKGIFTETFKNDNTKHIRKNEHVFYMESQKKILTIAKNAGFILKAQYDMGDCGYDNQYLYILKKPN